MTILWRFTLEPDNGNVSKSSALLEAQNLVAGYGKQDVLHDLSLTVNQGEIVSVLGHNGAGKTTLLRTLLGILPLRDGTVYFGSEDVTQLSHVDRVRRGMTFTPAEAPVFRELSVADNLDLGTFTLQSRDAKAESIEAAIDIFPFLKERIGQDAGTMSGGEQRIVSLGIALAARPKLMMLDEPSLGIAPALVESMFEDIRQMAESEGLSVLMVEQNVRAALRVTGRVYYMRNGSMIHEESGEEALQRDNWWELF